MKIKEGDKIPNSEFYYLDETGTPKKISTSELFIDRFDRGQGTRSARYTMLVENNIATKIKAEEDTATCEMSAAENFLVSI